ncbi:hypothetical protein DsansV1_C53g0266031 [Dioscorea sansibarensis]
MALFSSSSSELLHRFHEALGYPEFSISSSLALEVEKSFWDRDFCEFLWSGEFKV